LNQTANCKYNISTESYIVNQLVLNKSQSTPNENLRIQLQVMMGHFGITINN